jgi:site-specific recombinase XerD
MESAVSDFLYHCRVERLAPLTCQAYERDVTACMTFLRGEGTREWASVKPVDLRRFLAAEQARRPAPASQARTVAALKGFFRFLVENEYLERDPALVLRTPRKRGARLGGRRPRPTPPARPPRQGRPGAHAAAAPRTAPARA